MKSSSPSFFAISLIVSGANLKDEKSWQVHEERVGYELGCLAFSYNIKTPRSLIKEDFDPKLYTSYPYSIFYFFSSITATCLLSKDSKCKDCASHKHAYEALNKHTEDSFVIHMIITILERITQDQNLLL